MAPDIPETLPGIVLPPANASAIENAARRTIEELHAQQLLTGDHALTVQLVLELARAVGHGLSAGRVSVATATLARQLLDAIETLPKRVEVTHDAWDEFMAKVAEAADQ